MNTLLRGKLLLLAWALAAPVFGAWEEGQQVPDLSDFALVGDTPSLEGKVTYIDFWASWCPPCKASFPAMERIYGTYEDRGFQIIAISVDSSEKAMDRFLERTEPRFATVWDKAQRLVADAGIEVMPTSFLVDASGTIRKVHFGWRGDETEAQLREEIEMLLEEKR